MAETLRFSLRLPLQGRGRGFAARAEGRLGKVLAITSMALVFLPLLPGLLWAMRPAAAWQVWRALLADQQFLLALQATLISAFGAAILALSLACALAISVFPGTGWRRVQRHLPALLSFPHAAFAIGIVFLIAPSGWVARLIAALMRWDSPPAWISVQDPYGLSLMLALAIKESGFLLWCLAALLREQVLARQMTVGASLGYGRGQIWRYLLLPQILPRLTWPLVAVLAYGLSVVDMGLILGPSTPPTLAVLAWQWLSDPDLQMQAQGSAAALVLVVLLVGIGALVGLAWKIGRIFFRFGHGRRRVWVLPGVVTMRGVFGYGLESVAVLPGLLALLILALWSLSGRWFFPALLPQSLTLTGWISVSLTPLLTSLWLGLACVAIALPLSLLWLEWGPSRYNGLLYSPLILPLLPLAAGQYGSLLMLHLDGTAAGVVWSHLVWVLPYMILVLVGPYRAFDGRLLLAALTLGHGRWRACLRVKWPMLLKPILAACAVGFAVSIAQYLPTLFAGGGRFATVTTEAVALSSGGNRRVLAVQAMLQALLPMLGFALAAIAGRVYARHRKGLQ